MFLQSIFPFISFVPHPPHATELPRSTLGESPDFGPLKLTPRYHYVGFRSCFIKFDTKFYTVSSLVFGRHTRVRQNQNHTITQRVITLQVTRAFGMKSYIHMCVCVCVRACVCVCIGYSHNYLPFHKHRQEHNRWHSAGAL
jgi:hypothetical protein